MKILTARNISGSFRTLGEAITSVGFVIFFMLFLIIGMIFLSHTLFTTVLQSTAMTDMEVQFASWFLALGFEFTILITAVNTQHLNKALPLIFAICSFFLLSFVLEAWTAETTLLKSIRFFIASMGATINYTYAELFQKKWKQYRNQEDYQELYELLFDESNQAKHERDRLQEQYQKSLKAVAGYIRHEDVLLKEIEELNTFKNSVQASLKCPYCKEVQKSHNSLRAHKGHCSKKSK